MGRIVRGNGIGNATSGPELRSATHAVPLVPRPLSPRTTNVASIPVDHLDRDVIAKKLL